MYTMWSICNRSDPAHVRRITHLSFCHISFGDQSIYLAFQSTCMFLESRTLCSSLDRVTKTRCEFPCSNLPTPYLSSNEYWFTENEVYGQRNVLREFGAFCSTLYCYGYLKLTNKPFLTMLCSVFGTYISNIRLIVNVHGAIQPRRQPVSCA